MSNLTTTETCTIVLIFVENHRDRDFKVVGVFPNTEEGAALVEHAKRRFELHRQQILPAIGGTPSDGHFREICGELGDADGVSWDWF